jgi:rubrerythrin
MDAESRHGKQQGDAPMKKGLTAQVQELLYQALETELGGISIYETATQLAVNDDLREEWREYLEQTKTHRKVLLEVFEQLDLDPGKRTPGREVCAHIGKSLVEAMQKARKAGDAEAAELVATEAVVLAESKDHLNWELIGHVAEQVDGDLKKVLQAAHEQVEDEEDHHLYHTKGWCRELWIDFLGFPAVLPPPEEVKQVETAIGASRAEHARESML